MGKLEDMMYDDGWELRSYENYGKEYFAWNKDGVQIADEDLGQIGDDDFRDWKVIHRE